MTIVLNQPYFSLFPLKITLKGRHFDTIEVIKTISQTVLNIVTEHDFQDAFKNGRSARNRAYEPKEITSRVIVAGRSKVSFLADGRISLENYGWLFVY
jgi:hypothetical protein